MKQLLDKFIMGTCHLLERQGAFYLAFFVFNCLPMCCYMVMKKNGEAMFSFACFMLLVNLLLVFLIDFLPRLAQRILKAILLAVAQKSLTADEIIDRTQIPARRVLSALTMLQLHSRVEEDAGRRFRALVLLKD